MNQKKIDRLLVIVHGLGSEVGDMVEHVASQYGSGVFDDGAKDNIEIDLTNEIGGVRVLDAAERRKALMRIMGQIGLLMALDEAKRGSSTIEREMVAFDKAKLSLTTKAD